MSNNFQVTILDNRAEFLRRRGDNITSQFGEDGYIRALFEHIRAANHWCFEVGAHDGLLYSNTKWMRDGGWRAVLIEADDQTFAKLEAQCAAKVFLAHRRITPTGVDSLDSILRLLDAPLDLDFGCIDIDGQDYAVWEGMKKFKPRVMLVEFSPYHSPDDTIETSPIGQAGLFPILRLGRDKGYVPLLHTYCNVLFVRKDVWRAAQ